MAQVMAPEGQVKRRGRYCQVNSPGEINGMDTGERHC